MKVLGIWLDIFSAVLRSESLLRSSVKIILENHLAEIICITDITGRFPAGVIVSQGSAVFSGQEGRAGL